MTDQFAAIRRLKEIRAARGREWAVALMIDFVLNVLAVTLALALLAMIVWRIACMLPWVGSPSVTVDIIVLLAVAIVFVCIRDYTNIL
jgi:hypothetical protein